MIGGYSSGVFVFGPVFSCILCLIIIAVLLEEAYACVVDVSDTKLKRMRPIELGYCLESIWFHCHIYVVFLMYYLVQEWRAGLSIVDYVSVFGIICSLCITSLCLWRLDVVLEELGRVGSLGLKAGSHDIVLILTKSEGILKISLDRRS